MSGKITANIAILLKPIVPRCLGMRELSGTFLAGQLDSMLQGQLLKPGETWDAAKGLSASKRDRHD